MTAPAVLAAAALLFATVACNSADDEGGGPGTSGGDTRGVDDASIKIGGVSALTSEQGGYPGLEVGVQARFERANRDGGVHGRQIDFVGVRDDGEDPGRNQELMRELVVEEEVFGIVPAVGQGLLPQSSTFLEQQQVPFIGWGFMPGFCDSNFGFGFNGCVVAPDVAATSLLEPLFEAGELAEGDSIAIQAYDGEAGRSGLEGVRAVAEDLGLEVVHDDTTMPGLDTVDFTPFVQQIMTSDGGDPPDAVVSLALFGSTIGLTGSLRGAGYEGSITNYLTYVPGFLDESPDVAAALEGSYVNVQFLPAEFDGPAIEALNADLDEIGEGGEFSIGIAIGYWSADLMVQMLEEVGEDLTIERFEEVINGGGFTYEPEHDPPGIGPVSFPEGHDEPAPCAALVRIVDGGYEPVEPMTCFETVPVG